MNYKHSTVKSETIGVLHLVHHWSEQGHIASTTNLTLFSSLDLIALFYHNYLKPSTDLCGSCHELRLFTYDI